MHILIVNHGLIPVKLYGGTERVIWGLGKGLAEKGHKVSYLVKSGSTCPFAQVIPIDTSRPIVDQIPEAVDLVHFQFIPDGIESVKKPYVITMHGNTNDATALSTNTIFVSKNHAERYGSAAYVHNGLDWSSYTKPDFKLKRKNFHFLGKASWRLKNVQGAIDTVIRVPKAHLRVLGGVRFNFSMGIRFTFNPRIHFEGMVGGSKKDRLLNQSKGLVFPVRWHEPFGLAIIESLYYGCPVFGTPYGSLPELVLPDVGFLSNDGSLLSEAIKDTSPYAAKSCHEYVQDLFGYKQMATNYLIKYAQVLNGGFLNATEPKLQKIQKGKFLEWK